MKTFFSCLLLVCSLSVGFSQGNLRFSYTVIPSGNTSTIMVYAYNSVPGTENMTSFTMNVYYDNTESSITTFDVSPLTTLSWIALPSFTTFNAASNASIPITHTGFGNVNVLDFLGMGTFVGQTPIHILTITADNSPGSDPSGTFYLSSSSEGHPEQVYNDNVMPIPNAYPVIIANPAPSPTISGLTEYCAGTGGVILDAGAGFASYLWSPGGETTQTISAMAGTYTVTVTDGLGGQGTSPNHVVTENPNPQPNFSGSLTYCASEGGTLLDAGSGFASYLWSPGGETTQSVFFNSGAGTVTVTDGNGCSTTIAFGTSSIPDLVPNVTGAIDYCEGSNTTLDAGSGFASYLWSPGGETTQTISATAGTYSVTVTDANGCSGTSSDVIVTENANPIPVISGSTTYCASAGSTTLDAGSGFTSYLWSPGGETTQTISATAGTYSVTVTDANGCSGTSADVVVTENANPIPVISGSTTYCASAGSTTLDAGSGFTSYLWSPGGETTQTISATAGTYSVTVTDANGCSGTSADVVVTENANPIPVISGSTTYCASAGSTTLDAGSGFTSYLWSPGVETTQTISATAGTYSVTVIDANGCSGTSADVVVTENANLSPVIAGATDYCEGSNTTLDAGSGFASYLWSPGGETTQTISATAGTYSVTVTDANGCSGTSADVVVTENANPIPVISGSTTYCASAGSTTLDAGSGFASYLWSPGGETTQTISATAGTYSVTVTDANGCSGTSADVVVTENANPTPVISGSTTYCASAGSTTLDAGSGFTSYLWSPGGETTQTISATAGTYSVTVTDANGCSGTSADVIVTENANLNPVIAGAIDYCEGSSTTLDAGSGFASYLWSPGGETTQTISATAGTYSVSVTDANGCSGTSADVVVTENANPTPVIAGAIDYCEGSSTSLDAGSGFASYLWSPGGETTQTISATAGTYSVSVTDANGCSGTSADVVVTENANPSPVIAGATDYCEGSNTTLDAGSGFASYLWSPGGETTQTISATAGTYSVTVTDANGCSGTSSDVIVTENANPTPVIAGATDYCEGSNTTLDAGSGFASYLWSPGGETTQTISATAGTYSVTVTDANGCSGTSSDVIVTENANPAPVISGSTTYCASAGSTTLDVGSGFTSYLWSPGGETTQTISATAGTYSVSVTDANGCSGTSADVVVTENANLSPVIAGATDYCEGSNTTLDAGSGFASYLWSPGVETTQTISATAGTYSVTVTDANGCSGTSADVVVTENANPIPVISGSTTYCASAGSTTLDAGSGFSSYLWSPGGETTQTISATAGTYSVTVTDANGCSGTSADVVVTENANLSPVIAGATDYCEGSNTSLDAGAGFASYLWSPGGETTQTISATAGTYSVTVTDANGCSGTSADVVVTENANPIPVISGSTTYCASAGSTTLDAGSGFSSYLWSPGGETTQIISATAGTYSVTVTDANGCSGTSSDVIVTENANPIPVISGSTTYCASAGSTTLEAGSGFASYLWSPGGETTQTISATAGTYSVSVTDANGCSGTSADVIVTENANPTPVIAGAIDYCEGSNTTLDAGSGFTSYLWSPGGETTQTISATAGTYSVTVTDANGCSGTSADVVVTENANPIPVISGSTTYCASAGSTTLEAGSGFASYLWSPGGETTQTISATAGTYSVTVTDANGCSGTSADVVVTENANLSPVIAGAIDYCEGSNTTLDAGSGFTSYLWSPGGETTQTISATAGTYSVTVTDANGCSGTSADVVVTENANLSPVIAGATDYCEGSNTTLDAGSGFTSYLWSPGGETTQTISATAGTYSVTVTDANGCSGTSADVIVTENANPTPVIAGATDYCEGSNTTLDAGSGFSSYLWSPGGETTQTISATAGTYSVTVTDANGCSGTSADVVVTENANPIPVISGSTTYCASAGSTTLEAGSVFASYLWSPGGETTQTISATAGTYSVTVTDANGCSGTSADVVVTETTPASWYLDADGDGFGDPNSSIVACDPPSGFVSDGTDCDDQEEFSFPGNPEICDGIDNNCDGNIDEGVCSSYCSSSGLDSQYEWIEKVEIGTISNQSGNDGGYADYTSISTDLPIGRSEFVTLTPGFSNGAFKEHWRIWIDLNHDGDFDDTGERVFQKASFYPINYLFTIPATATPGPTRMRVSMRFNKKPNACQNFPFGEVEDYTVNLVVPPCGALPTDWYSQDIGNAAHPGSACYDPTDGSFSVSSAGKDIYGKKDKFHFAYTDLCGDGEIIARVQDIMPTGAFAFAGIMMRESTSTFSKNVAMLKRTNGNVLFQSRFTTAGLTSSAQSSASLPGWIKLTRTGNTFVGYVSQDGVSWTVTYSSTVHMANCLTVGLAVSSNYTRLVNTSVFDNVSVNPLGGARRTNTHQAATVMTEGSTHPKETREEAALIDKDPQLMVLQATVYPNPTQEEAFLECQAIGRLSGTLEIYSIMGQLVYETSFEPTSTATLALPVSSLSSGVYVVKLKLEDNRSLEKRLVVSQ